MIFTKTLLLQLYYNLASLANIGVNGFFYIIPR